MKYRPEIDGLRALAVIPVILFHAGFDLFSGGFVGVDVFFVISGYLITTIIIEDLELKRFSIINFYERRARRILPALFFVMLFCIPFAWMWMLPNQIKDFAQSIVAVSLFVSNIQFWRESGYFDSETDEKPLLHTWSLAVEEQYYLLFPIFLIFMWQFGKNRVFWMLFFLALFSLLISEWGWRKNPNANFYLAPSRFWEIFIGSMTALILKKNGVVKNNLLALLGLSAIILAIFIYDEKTPFPSIYTLLPVLGVVLIISFANKGTLVGSLLGNKVFVGIGLISYSAYLWHQPLFAFSRIRLTQEPSVFLLIILSIFSLVLGFLSWRYIEKPFRNKNIFSRFKIFLFSFIIGLIMIIFGLIVHFNPYLFIPNYHWAKILEGNSGLSEKCDATNGKIDIDYCSTKSDPILAVYGDSHSMHLVDGFSSKFKKNLGLIQFTKSGCAPLINIAQKDNRYDDCVRFNSETLKYIKNNKSIKFVIISSRFSLLDEGINLMMNNEIIDEKNKKEQLVLKGLFLILEDLKDSGKEVILFSNTPRPKEYFKPAECVLKSIINNRKLKNCEFIHENRSKNKGLFIFDQIKINGIQKIDLTEQICKHGVCNPYFDKKPIYGAGTHLSKNGAKYLSRKYGWEKLITAKCDGKNCSSY